MNFLQLTNYWWLLIWLFAGGAVLGSMQKHREVVCGKPVERWNVFCWKMKGNSKRSLWWNC